MKAGVISIEEKVLFIAPHFEEGVGYVVGDFDEIQSRTDCAELSIGKRAQDGGEQDIKTKTEEEFVANFHRIIRFYIGRRGRNDGSILSVSEATLPHFEKAGK
jgi:hypothetical protein